MPEITDLLWPANALLFCRSTDVQYAVRKPWVGWRPYAKLLLITLPLL